MSDPYPSGFPLVSMKKELHIDMKKAELFESSQDESHVLPLEKEVSLLQFTVNEEVPKVEQPMKHMRSENQMHSHVQTSEIAEPEEDKIEYLSGNQFFDVVLAKTYLHQLQLPKRISGVLPHATVPTVLRYGGKDWNVSYKGNCRCPRFEPDGWKDFVKDNGLEKGDACVFEMMENENTKIRFKVHILKAEVPCELLLKEKICGSLPSNPIAID